MRVFRLISIAASAEAVLLRRRARQAEIRTLLFGVGVAFSIGAFVFSHVAALSWLRENFGIIEAAGIVGAADAVLAMLFIWLSLRATRDPMADEALAVRQQAQAELMASLERMAVFGRVLTLLLRAVRSSRG